MRLLAQLTLDTQELVKLGYTVSAASRSGFNQPRVRRHC
jgi:hypothetical protein